MIKKNKLKEEIKKQKYRIGNNTLDKLQKIIESDINNILKKATRSARISGRKTILTEDF
jgi:histone H3/H4